MTFKIKIGAICDYLRFRRTVSPMGAKATLSPPAMISPTTTIGGRSATDPSCFSIISTAACNRMLNLDMRHNWREGADLVTADNHDFLSSFANGNHRTVLVNPSS